MAGESPKAGDLLIAEPMMADPNFRRTVVLLCAHDEEGSFGLVLGDFLETTLSSVLEYEGNFDSRLRLGGPMQQNTLHVIHQYEEVPQCEPLLPGIYWGGDFDTLIDLIRSEVATPDKMMFFLGYAGWGAGQLASELADNDWMVTSASREVVFETDPDRLWRTVLRQMGGTFAYLANFPDDPRMN